MRTPEFADGLRRVEVLDSNSSTERILAGARIGPLAFAGIVPVSGVAAILFVVHFCLSLVTRGS